MNHPYQSAPPTAFWRPAIAERKPEDISELWEPKFNFKPNQKIATFGSCFAQHIGKVLQARGYRWFDTEKAPEFVSPELQRKYGYGIFSARTGNIYTAAALRQWVEWALRIKEPPDEVWQKDGRYFDPFRPAIEPDGFASLEELLTSREAVLSAFCNAISNSYRIVFTLGLTEAWINKLQGYTYAVCPGVVAGTFDSSLHEFKNYDFNEIRSDLSAAIDSIHSVNKRVRILLTVSPVPLTATASGRHVLTATTYSKSVLRAVAGWLADRRDVVDYFPAYEIITGTPFQAKFYAANKRDVTPEGVEFVMNSFFAALAQKYPADSAAVATTVANTRPALAGSTDPLSDAEADVVCEERMLEAFAR